MKAEIEEVSKLERKLNIQVPATKVDEHFLKAYQGVQRQAEIKGFRKGKAPLDVIRKKYKDHIVQDVIQHLVQEAYVFALDHHSLEPISHPEINLGEIAEGKDFSFTAKLEIRPEVELKKIEGLKVEKEKLSVEEKDVDKVIEDMRQNRATMEDIEDSNHSAKNGEIAVIDFEGFIDGEPLENGKGENHPLSLGSNQFIPGFEEQVEGIKAGEEKEIQVSFPEEYHAKDIAGKDAVFKIKCHKIQTRKLPELNEEFAKSIGTYDSIEAMKKDIRSSLERQEETRIKEGLKNKLIEKLVEANDFEVPQSLVAEQRKHLIDDVKNKMKQQGLPEESLQEYVEKWDDDLNSTASQIIKSSFIINEIAKKHEIKVESADKEAKLQKYAAETNIPLDQLKSFYAKPEAQEKLSLQVLEEKVIDFVLSKSELIEK